MYGVFFFFQWKPNIYVRSIESLCCAPETKCCESITFQLKKKTHNHSILIGPAVNNIYIVIIMVQTLIIDIIKSMLLRWHGGKESACNVGDMGSIPGSRRSPGEGNGSPLQ